MEKSKITRDELINEINSYFNSSDYLFKVHALLKKFLDNGYSWEIMHKNLEDYMFQLREQNKEDEEDFILDALGFLDGWCNPEMSLENYKQKEKMDDENENCKQCGHPSNPHVIIAYDIKDFSKGGEMRCPVDDCKCFNTIDFNFNKD